MPAVCKSCGSVDIQFYEPADDGGWHGLLVTLSDQVPSKEHCADWLDSWDIPETTAVQVAIAMQASIRYDLKKKAWMYNGKPFYVIWRVFQSWCLRDLRQNGHRASGLQVKSGRY